MGTHCSVCSSNSSEFLRRDNVFTVSHGVQVNTPNIRILGLEPPVALGIEQCILSPVVIRNVVWFIADTVYLVSNLPQQTLQQLYTCIYTYQMLVEVNLDTVMCLHVLSSH